MQRKMPIRFAFAALLFLALAAPTQAPAFRAPDEGLLPPVQGIASDISGATDSNDDRIPELEEVDISTPSQGPASGAPSGNGSPVEGLMRKAGSEARDKRVLVDEFGRKHVRMGQFYKGIPVVGAEIVVHHSPEGRAEHMNGKLHGKIAVDTTPAVARDVAVQIGLDEHAGKAELKLSQAPALAIRGNRLAYHYVITHSGANPGQWHYYVCAHTGAVLQRYNDIKFLAPSAYGTYETVNGDRTTGEGGTQASMPCWKDTNGDNFLYHKARRWGVYNDKVKDWVHQPGNNWQARDRAAISCAYNLFLTQVWVQKHLSRNSYDNLGGFARGNVHYGTNYVNAYWDGRSFYFGDGDGIRAGELVSLDIVAHEYGHAITQYTSNLNYSGESGALNESYSDIMGCAVEWTYQPRDLNGPPGYSDWTLGEDAWLSAPALRDMRNPKAYGQPSYYKGQYWYAGTQDNGGVHTNSGVQNFAFYLLARGGTGKNEGRPYTITGLGVPAAAKVAMRANMVYLTSTARYLDSRRAWVRAAQDLGYPVQTVHAAWNAVGVFDPLVP